MKQQTQSIILMLQTEYGNRKDNTLKIVISIFRHLLISTKGQISGGLIRLQSL